ncbi:hypothetical protein [Thermococcus sp.]|uniref:hypothetical protein n=1 Tax=Thermococcus sp. TaxID=35749 RepID=UPI002626E9B1|nr:hypothetical protein [Thermococcus sp.]
MDAVGAKNLVDSPEVYEKLTPWEPSEILRPFRKYYELKISLGNLNPRTSAILLMRAETGADTYTSALYLSTTLRAKISSLQSTASWKRNNAGDILKHIPHKQGSLKEGEVLSLIQEGVELAASKLNSLQLNNTRSKLPHWILKTHIAKCLARETVVLTEWTMVNKRYDLYLPLEKLKVEIKYSWGYTQNYGRYQGDRDIYVIVGKNVSPEKIERLSELTGSVYILYRLDYEEFFVYGGS